MRTGSALHTQQARQRILVVDDHPMTRHGLAQRIGVEPDMEVCLDVGTIEAALRAMETRSPDLVLVDLSLGDQSGLELIKDLQALHPDVPVLVFSMHYESLYAERALRAGARGYIMKSEGAEALIDAMRRVLKGEVYLSPTMRNHVVHRFAGRPAVLSGENAALLSDRELEVFELIGNGLTTRKVSERLHLSVSTIETYRAHIKEKLNLRTGTELIRAAVQWVTERHAP